MALGIHDLLNLPAWRAFDIDDSGRILAGYDAAGSLQLVELAPDGGATPLTALPGPCSGRYLPGRRAAVVVHDDGGNERSQLSVLRLDTPPAEPVGLDALEPLVRDPKYIHTLIDVDADRIVYSTNRRNGVDFDVVLRSLADGTETVVYDGGGNVEDVALAPGRADGVLALVGARPASEQLLAFGRPEDAGAVRELTGADEHAQYNGLQWRPDGTALLVHANPDREFVAVLALDPATGGWTELVADPEHDLRARLSRTGAPCWWPRTWTAPRGSRCTTRSPVNGCAACSCRPRAGPSASRCRGRSGRRTRAGSCCPSPARPSPATCCGSRPRPGR